MLKWLASLLVVLLGFLVILLALGYLLKENEAQTTALKQTLAREQALKEQARKKKTTKASLELSPLGAYIRPAKMADSGELDTADNTRQKNRSVFTSIIRVADEYSTCQVDQQCLLFNVNPSANAPGCWLPVNSQGAAILTKISAMYPDDLVFDSAEHCTLTPNARAVCAEQGCTAKVVIGDL